MDVEQMVLGKAFWLAVFAAVGAILISIVWPEKGAALAPGTVCQLFYNSLSSEVVLFLLPLIAVLPYAEGFLKEYQSGAIKLIISRTSRKEYGKGKLAVLAVSGGLTFAAACLLAFFLLFLLLYPIETKGSWDISEVQKMLTAILRLCMVSNICSVLSGIFALLFLSGYMAYGMPFVIFYLLVILNERYATKVYCLNPKEWLWPVHDWGEGGWGMWIFLLVLWLFLNLIHTLILYQRIKEI